MTTNALPVLSTSTAMDHTATASRLVDSFLKGRSEKTQRAYGQDMEDFRRFVEAETLDEAAGLLMGKGHGEANALALDYKDNLIQRGLATNTVNRRLAALRSLVKLARTLGMVPWTLDISNVKGKAYRDTRGPGRSGYRRLLDKLDERLGAKARRDRAAVRLLYDMALRRGEVVGLDVEDVDLEAGTVEILGKGRTQKERLTIPEPTRETLAHWLEARGTEDGPLFVNFDRAGKGKRLTGTSLYRIIRDLGQDVGLTVRPHGLRHAAITEALDLTNGNVRAVQRFSRHVDVKTLNHYDDNRQDLAGEVAALVAKAAGESL